MASQRSPQIILEDNEMEDSEIGTVGSTRIVGYSAEDAERLRKSAAASRNRTPSDSIPNITARKNKTKGIQIGTKYTTTFIAPLQQQSQQQEQQSHQQQQPEQHVESASATNEMELDLC